MQIAIQSIGLWPEKTQAQIVPQHARSSYILWGICRVFLHCKYLLIVLQTAVKIGSSYAGLENTQGVEERH